MSTQSEVLNSWKEISNYIGRGVRTVQRWEKDFGLPVRRPSGHLKGSVFAVRQEVDEWVTSCGAREGASATQHFKQAGKRNPHVTGIQNASIESFHKNAGRLHQQCESMRDRFERLTSTLARTKVLRDEMKSLCGVEAKAAGCR